MKREAKTVLSTIVAVSILSVIISHISLGNTLCDYILATLLIIIGVGLFVLIVAGIGAFFYECFKD